jgi:predicted membrane protein
VGCPSALFERHIMTLLSLVITLIVVGILLWAVNSFISMDGKIKQILDAVVVIAVVLWLLKAFGLLGGALLNTPL